MPKKPTIESESSENKLCDKVVSEMKIAVGQPARPVTRMLTKDKEDLFSNNPAITQINAQLLDPGAVPPFICQLCSVAFLTKRELQLHVMCHGINIICETPPKLIENPGDIVLCKSSSPQTNGKTNKTQSNVPGCELTATPPDKPLSSSQGNHPTSGNSNSLVDPPQGSVVVNREVNYGKIVDVLSLATATRGFKEPGSIWCSLCKCTVDKGHICKVHQTSYHAEKTEEGFTCELCGRFYNQKRKLRTHLRNRHKGFRLQEDEGYMCWQCWQAFPEIKILEEHIVTVHGHESRRQNSTWRPYTQPSTLPFENNSEEPTSPDVDLHVTEPDLHAKQQKVNLKRPSDDSVAHCPVKKSMSDMSKDIINVAEVNGKIVVSDSNGLSPEHQPYPQDSGSIINHPVGGPVSTPDVSGQPQLYADNESIKKTEESILNYSSANSVPGSPSSSVSNSDRKTSHSLASFHDFANKVDAPKDSVKKKHLNHKLPQQCPHCPEKFSKNCILQMHVQECHGENVRCFFCSKSYSTKETLAAHIKTAHTEDMKCGKCPICQGKCLGELDQHIIQYHYKDLLTRKAKEGVLSTCPICHQSTTDAFHLRWHILKEHRGLQLPGELAGLADDACSDSGSSVTSEGRRSSEGSDGMSGISKAFGENEQGKSKESSSELEIVFVSDKSVPSDWSNGHDAANHILAARGRNVAAVKDCIKTLADSSVGINGKQDANSTLLDNVHSTTGQEELSREGSVIYDCQLISEETCIFCFKKFSKGNLSSHLRTDHGWVDTFTCSICSFQADKYLSVVEHFCQCHFHPTDDVATSRYNAKCLKCDIIFQDIAHLKKHSAALHSFQLPSQATYNTFKCRHCNIIFEKQFDAQKHFDVYHLFRIRFKCESCRMGFTAKHDFQEHITCNHPELVKSFCPVCGLGFEVSSALEEHVFEMHRRKAQFYCAQCGSEFADRFHVHMHIRSNCCVTWADSNFECLDCLTAFSSISELRIHCKQKNCKVKK